MTFHLRWPLDKIRPADYNPRRIDDESFLALRQSIKTYGFAKPVIVARDGLLVAGHQRTRAAQAEGVTHVPAWHIAELGAHDEIRFNQLHNGADLDQLDDEDEGVSVDLGRFESVGGIPEGRFVLVPPTAIKGDLRSRGAAIRHEICSLLSRYGNWGCAILTFDGKVISGQQYALASKQVQREARIFRLPRTVDPVKAEETLTRPYGAFNYDGIKRETFHQTLAQPHRKLDREVAHLPSKLYLFHVEKDLSRTARYLDFGCGEGAHIGNLKAKGYKAFGIEFFRRDGFMLNKTAVHAMINEVCADIRANGLFDVVICDYVLNSTDSPQAEADVMNCIGAFTRPGGVIYLAATSRRSVVKRKRARLFGGNNPKSRGRAVEFLDENGYTASFRDGRWFFQKFYETDDARNLIRRHLGADPLRWSMDGNAFYASIVPQRLRPVDEIEASIAREFDLLWPNGESVGKSAVVLDAWRFAAKFSKK